MWRLILILALAATEIESWEELGCKFMEDITTRYKLPVTKEKPSYPLGYKEELAANFNVRFGDKVTPMKFANINEVEKLIKTIQPMFAELMKDYLVSDIPEFIRYYNQLKTWREGYEKFVRQYIPTSLQEVNGLSYPAFHFAIKILQDIYQSINKVKKENCFLVAVYEGRVVTGDNINQRDLIHVAAAIQIKVDTKSGVILMDIGENAFGPVVLMDHSSGKSNPSQTSGSSKVISFAGERYDLSLTKNGDKTYVEVQNTKTKKVNTYDISAPYCSFLTTTFKRQFLMKSSKSIFARDGEGHRTASITFDLIEENPKFTMTIYNTDGPETTENIGFEDLGSMDSTQLDHYDKVLDKLCYGHPESPFHKIHIKNYLITVVQIFKNRKFITDFNTENRKYLEEVKGKEDNTKN